MRNAQETTQKLLDEGDIRLEAAVKGLLAGQILIMKKLEKIDQLENQMKVIWWVGSAVTGIVLMLVGAWLKSAFGL